MNDGMPDPMKVLEGILPKYEGVDIFYTKKSIGRPKQCLSTNHVKKDALWKPLFRKFRRFIKDQVNTQVHIKDIDEIDFE